MNVHALPQNADPAPQAEDEPRSPFLQVEDALIRLEALYRALRRVHDNAEDAEDVAAQTVLIDLMEKPFDELRSAYDYAFIERLEARREPQAAS